MYEAAVRKKLGNGGKTLNLFYLKQFVSEICNLCC